VDQAPDVLAPADKGRSAGNGQARETQSATRERADE